MLVAALALAAVWATQFALLAPTNFTRTDEWLYVSLTSRGIVDCPHMQRPLALLWALPGALLPHRFVGFHLTDGVYVLLTGWLVFLLARRLSGDVVLALLAGVFALVWAPRDMNRLLTVQATVAAGPTCATLLAFVLLVEAGARRRALLLVLAGAVAFVTVRSYEATAALMLGGPLLVLLSVRARLRSAPLRGAAPARAAIRPAPASALRPPAGADDARGRRGGGRIPGRLRARGNEHCNEHRNEPQAGQRLQQPSPPPPGGGTGWGVDE